MAKQRHLSGLSGPQQQFVKLIEQVDYHGSSYERFRDFCELAAMTLVLPFEPSQRVSERIERIHKKYDKAKIELFGKAFDILIEALEESYHDFLGPVYMSLEISNDRSGQFFTPWHICKVMAKMQLPTDLDSFIDDCGGFITVNDPCVGAGAIPLAAVDEFKERRVDYSNKMFIVAQDIDMLCCYMAYIQLSLCGVAAEVINGNSLIPSNDYECWHTPVYYLNCWPLKLALKQSRTLVASTPEKPEPDIKITQESNGQLAFDFGIKEAV